MRAVETAPEGPAATKSACADWQRLNGACAWEIISLPAEAEALLPQLGVEAADITRVEAMAGGLSGGRVYRLWLRGSRGADSEYTRVLKYSEPLEGWLGDTSGDTRIREAQLVASGILDDLPRDIVTPTLAVAFGGTRQQPTGAALLMRDMRRYLLPQPYRTPPGTIGADAVALVDRLARMHARFWNDPRLDDPALGLMSPERALLVTGPLGVAARLAAGDTLPYLPIAAESWETFFALAGESATERFQAIMTEPGRIVRAIEKLPRTLVHGDVWGPNLGWLPAVHGSRRHYCCSIGRWRWLARPPMIRSGWRVRGWPLTRRACCRSIAPG